MKKRIGSILSVFFLMVSIFEVSNISASAVGKIRLDKTAITLQVGEKYRLSVKNIPKSGKVTWTSTSKSNAAVSKKGVVTAKKQGRATIRAKIVYRSGGERRTRNFSCMVTVTGKSESVSNAVAKPSVPQNGNEIETDQPEQTVSGLKITAEGVPVEVRLASDGQYSYGYSKDEYAVMTTTNGSTFEIKVTDIRPEIGSGNQTNVIVYIPDESYTLITGVSIGSSLILPAINVDITVTSNASSVVINLPSDYDKTLNYTGNASSCSLSMSDINDFGVNVKIFTPAVSVQSSWPAYDMLSSSYNYTSGNGTAKINIDVTDSSFIFE